jgi:hypothetical protein
MLQLAAPILMMLDCEVRSAMWAKVTMAVMLGFGLPDIVLGRGREVFG